MRLEQALYNRLSAALGLGAIVLALNAVIYFTAVSRLDRFARTVKAQVASNRDTLAGLETQDRGVTAGVEHVKNNRQVVTDLANKVLLTKSQRMVEVQKALMAAAEAHRLQIDTLSYGYKVYPKETKSTWGHRYLELDISMPVSGPYQELKGLMADLQASPQFFTMPAMSLGVGGQGSAVVQGSFQLATYFIATDQDLKEIESKREKAQ